MTPVVLLDELKRFAEEAVKDITLPVRPLKNITTPEYREKKGISENGEVIRGPPKVYKMRLPNKEAEQNEIPYIVLQYLTGKDEKKDGESAEATCQIRLLFAVYSEDGSEGAVDLLNVITRLRVELLKKVQVGNFLLRRPLENIIYIDDTTPYFLGEMLTLWEIPNINREVIF